MPPSMQNNQSQHKTNRNNTPGTNTNHTQIQKRPQKNKKMINMNEGTIHDLMHDVLEYERKEAIEEAIEETRQQLIEETRQETIQKIKQEKMEIANNLINEGIPMKQIAKATKLDINTIKQLNIGK